MSALARTLSILGHPLLVLPMALLLTAPVHADARMQILLGLLGFGAVVMAWSWWQVRSGRWGHVDASARHERRSMNRFLLIALLLGALLAWRTTSPEVAAGIALAAMLVLAAMASARWCTLSLHVAFALYATCVVWMVTPWAPWAGLAMVCAVAWSRWRLRRHTPRDLFAGALAGAVAGAVFWWIVLRMGAH